METLENKFLEVIPDKLENGILYISMGRSVAIHLCVCGCGNEVVTPLSPTDWQLKFDGKVVSLSPSIGNWNFKCRSHYWITQNKVRWSGDWDEKQIEFGRNSDKKRKKEYFDKRSIDPVVYAIPGKVDEDLQKVSILKRVLLFFGIR